MTTKPTLDQIFPRLAQVESLPLAECQAGYDRLDISSPGDQTTLLYKAASDIGSTRAMLERWWELAEVEQYGNPHVEDFMLSLEYMIRLSKGTAIPPA